MDRNDVISRLKANRHLLDAYAVRKLYIFGSVAKDDAKDTSDVDILVEFEDNARIGLIRFSRLQHELSELLGCEVDLTTPGALHKEMKKRILEEAIHAA